MIETPKTRDESSLKLWISLFTVSFIILAILIYKFKKNYILNKNMYNFFTFLYMFIKINNNIDTYRKTYQNANSIAYILSTFVDQKNDGGLSVGSENNLLNYTDEENTYTLYYNSETDELIYNDKSLYASEDNSLEISITYLEKYEDKQLIKFEISYDNNKRSMSLIKTLY